jgi:pimeloyl-ACP methyl ester carboxylesterase/predicted glycosyltransferase
MRAREPDRSGVVERDGVKLAYEVHGDGPLTLLLLPTWTIIHARFWKLQVPWLARGGRVVVYDGPGNGGSTPSTDPADYGHDAQVAYALAVMDATGTDRACVVSLSQAANWALDLAANHRDRVLGSVFISPSMEIADGHPGRSRYHLDDPEPAVPPSAVPMGGRDPVEHWSKYNLAYWREHYEDFLWFFFGQCFPERHASKPVEDCVGWGLETSADVLAADAAGKGWPARDTLERWCARVGCPVLVIHGDRDRISPLARGERLAELTRGELLVLEGSGHIPLARDPVPVNTAIDGFVAGLRPRTPARARWVRAGRRPPRVLYLSSPIGLGHARRDLAIARALRERRPEVRIDWLAQHPVTRVLEDAGERLHPASAALGSESAHVESESGEHDLHCFEALRRMDEILVANFAVFHRVVTDEPYDLVVGDEAWEVDHFLHENPELKRYAYAWLTDFVGYLPVADDDPRRRFVAADYNAEMIGHIARSPRIRDRALFVGDPEDVVAVPFGPDLPEIRAWTQAHYDFPGYVTGFETTALDRQQVRAELGYRDGEQVCLVTVGGSGVGGDLLRRVVASFDDASRRVPGLRMVVVTGPRIAPASLPSRAGMEVHGYVPDLHRHLAACDLAIVQGGLTTCMELTATGRPFVYVPLRHHFEQQVHVAHRLDHYGAGYRLDYDDATPDHLAELIATRIGRRVSYRQVATDGADRAATSLAELL